MSVVTPVIVPRHKMVAFYGIPTGQSGLDVSYFRMKKFTQFTFSKNPKEYNRQYVDEPFGENDVMGYDPSISYAFDKYRDLVIQEDIVGIHNREKIGDNAVRSILLVDTDTGDAYERRYAIIPNAEGDNINVYTYSGTMKCRGELVHGEASSNDDWSTCTFTPASA